MIDLLINYKITKIDKNFCLNKVLLTRFETINLKHIMTECFVRNSIDIESYLKDVDYTLKQYITFITNKIRQIYKYPRFYDDVDLNCLSSSYNIKDCFFEYIELYNKILGNKSVVVLDFDGVVTKKSFKDFYERIHKTVDGNVIINTANPNVNIDWFIKNGFSLPKQIYANKGKIKKIRNIKSLSERYHVFLIDDEDDYLIYGNLFIYKTYKFMNNKIKYFSIKTK